MFSHLTSDVFDKIEPIDLTRAVIFHINAKEDRLYEDDNYDGNIIPYLTHEELLIYTMYQLECSLEGGRGSIHSFFITEPYCNYRPYYKEAFETMKCYDIAHLLEEAEKIGCKTINGLGMMLYQGAASFKLWTDQDMPIDVVKEALDF